MESCNVYNSTRENDERIKKMLNKENGITLIALTVTIVIILIISSISIYSGISTIRYVKFQDAKSQIEIMQTKTNELYEEYKKDNTIIENYGVSTSDPSCNATKLNDTFQAVQMPSEEREKYRYFSSTYIKDNLGIEGITYDFLINIMDNKVLLFNGIKYEGKMYYLAEQFDIKNISYQSLTGNTGSNDLVFKDGYIIVSNIQLPEGVSKYNLQYKLKTSNTWITVSSDNKKESYTDYYGTNYENVWCIKVPKEGLYETRVTISNKSGKDDITEETKEILISKTEFLKENEIVLKENTEASDENEDKIVIPKNFKIARITSKVTEGIVVEDKNGNQYVWIPVFEKTSNRTWGVQWPTGIPAKTASFEDFTQYRPSNQNNDVGKIRRALLDTYTGLGRKI